MRISSDKRSGKAVVMGFTVKPGETRYEGELVTEIPHQTFAVPVRIVNGRNVAAMRDACANEGEVIEKAAMEKSCRAKHGYGSDIIGMVMVVVTFAGGRELPGCSFNGEAIHLVAGRAS